MREGEAFVFPETSGAGDRSAFTPISEKMVQEEIMKKILILTAAFTAFFAVQTFAAQELRFSWWGGDTRHKPTLAAIKLFESKNPGVKIHAEYMGWDGYPERLTTQISGGNEPDIMQINWAWISTMYSKNGDGFYDLYKAKDIIKLSEWGTSINDGVWKGKLNAIPISYTGRIFVWNKTQFEKAGVKIPATWDDIFAAGKTFQTKLGNDYYPVDGQISDMVVMAQSYVLQMTGKQIIDPNAPKLGYTKNEAMMFIQALKKLQGSHAAVPLKLRYSTAPADTMVETLQEWVTGKWCGSIVWDSRFSAIKSSLPKATELVVGDYPMVKNAKSYGIFGRTSQLFAVSKHSKDPRLAAKFINFMMTDPEAITVLGDSRGIPLTKTGYAVLDKAGKINPMSKKALEIFKKRKIDMPSAYFEHTKFQNFIRSIAEDYLLGKTNEDQAANRIMNDTNKLLQTIL
jgi:oligogalacturonide transport system substrate-binding protein